MPVVYAHARVLHNFLYSLLVLMLHIPYVKCQFAIIIFWISFPGAAGCPTTHTLTQYYFSFTLSVCGCVWMLVWTWNEAEIVVQSAPACCYTNSCCCFSACTFCVVLAAAAVVVGSRCCLPCNTSHITTNILTYTHIYIRTFICDYSCVKPLTAYI